MSMTREEALKYIPPGWVECDFGAWSRAYPSGAFMYKDSADNVTTIYFIPAPKPEPRRVPVGEGFTLQVDASTLSSKPAWIPMRLLDAATWQLDLDAREWVEVLE